jgi:hypothetical protein
LKQQGDDLAITFEQPTNPTNTAEQNGKERSNNCQI